MNLTLAARGELRDILINDFRERAKMLSDSELNELGCRLLRLTAIAMKRDTEALQNENEYGKPGTRT